MRTLADSTYIQKSKLFLFPLIEVKRDPFIKPEGYYVRDAHFTEQDYRLILPFPRDESSEFHFYETELIDSPHFDKESYYETEKYLVYVYNLSKLAGDYDKFLLGKYTELSQRTKTLINLFWGRSIAGKFEPHHKIDAYLSPTTDTYRRYAKELDVPVQLLIEVKELLNPPNIEKETFTSDDRISKVGPTGGDSVENSSL